MAEGGRETDAFKLTVKVDLIGESNANEKLQKVFQGDIVNLRQHLQSYPELQSQYIYCVTEQSKHLRFEFWLKTAKALEELKSSTENGSLVNALSNFSEKKALGLDIGLGSQQLCFKCEIDGKQYAQGQAHFMEGSRDSGDESDETDDQQKQSNETRGAASGAETKEKEVFGEFKTEEMTEKTNQGTSDVKKKAAFFEQRHSKEGVKPKDQQKKSNGGGAETKEKEVFGEFKTEEMTEEKTNQGSSDVKKKAAFFEQRHSKEGVKPKDQQKKSNETQGAASGAETKEKEVFGEFRTEEMTEEKTNQGSSDVKKKAAFFEQRHSKEGVNPKSHQKQSDVPQGAPSGTEPNEKKGFRKFKKEETTAKKTELQSSADGSTVDAVGHTGQPQRAGSPDASDAGAGTPMTLGANVTPTGSPSDPRPNQATTDVKKLASLFGPKKSKTTDTSVEHSAQSGENKTAQPMVAQTKLSFGAGTVDASSERATQPGTTHITSQHGGDEAKTTQSQTNRSHDVDSFVQQQLSEQPVAMIAASDFSVHQQDSSQSGVSEQELQIPQEHQQPEANSLEEPKTDSLEESTEQTIRCTSNEQAAMITQETNTATLEANTSTMTQVPEKTTISTMFTTTESTVVPATNTFSAQPPVSASSTVASISSKTVIPTTSSEADAISTSTQYAASPSAATSDTTTPITTMLTATFNSTTEQIIISSTMVEPSKTIKEEATLLMPQTSTITMTDVSTTTISTMSTSTESTDVPTTVTTTITTTSPTHPSITTSITVATPSSTMVISTESDTTSTIAQSAVTPTSTAQPTTTATNEITKAAIMTSQTASSSEMTEQTITRQTMMEQVISTTEETTTAALEGSTSTMTKVPTTTTTSTLATTTKSTDVPTAVTNTSTTQSPASTSSMIETISSTAMIPWTAISEADASSTTTMSTISERTTSVTTITMTELQNRTSTTMPASTETTSCRTATGSMPMPTSSNTTGSEMAEGGREQDAFKLTLRIKFSSETTLNEDAITKVKNNLQGSLPLLQKHFQEDVKYKCLHLSQIKKLKKCVLGFELLIFNSDELDQIKTLTTERQLDKALSAFFDKHGLHCIAGLDPARPAFLCKLEDKYFYKGKAHFSKKSSDSEEDEEEVLQQQLSVQPVAMTAASDLSVQQQDASLSGVSEQALQIPQEHQQPEADSLEEPKTDNLEESTDEVKDDLNQDGSYAGGQKFQNPRQLLKQSPIQHPELLQEECSGEKETFRTEHFYKQDVELQAEGQQYGHTEQGPILYFSESDPQKYQQQTAQHEQLRKQHKEEQEEQLPTEFESQLQQSAADQSSHANVHWQQAATQDKGFEKHLHIYVPWKLKDIVKISARIIQQDPQTEVSFSQCDEYLWISSFKIDQPYILPRNNHYKASIIYVERNRWGQKTNRHSQRTVDFNFTSSPVDRILWCHEFRRDEIVTHMKYILKNCLSDLRYCLFQTEELLRNTSAVHLDLQIKKSIIEGIRLDLLSNNQQKLLFAVMVAILATGENEEFVKNIETLLSKMKKQVLEKLIHAFCTLVLTDIPSTCVENLKKFSFWVFNEYYGTKFCLLIWRQGMPILDDADFICYMKQGLQITIQEDEKSVGSIRDICLHVRDKILKHESEMGQIFLSNMLKQLSVQTHLNMYREMFYGDQSTRTDLQTLSENFKQSLMNRIKGYALNFKKDKSIETVNNLWNDVKMAGLGSEQELISTFEDIVIGLWNESTSGHSESLKKEWCMLCEDDILFASGKHQQTLLCNISKAKHKAMHNYMLKLAHMEKYKTSVNSYMVQNWYSTAVDEHVRKLQGIQDRLVSWYYYLGSALNLLEATSIRNQEVADKLSKSLYKKIEADTLNASDHLRCADKIQEMTNYKELIFPIFKQHAVKLLEKKHGSQNPEEIIETICGKELSLAKDWQADIVIILMKIYAPRGESAQERVFSMVPHHAFWTTVFRLNGKLHHKVSEQVNFRVTVDSLLVFRKSLKDFTVQVACIEGISSEMEDHLATLLKTETIRKEAVISAIQSCKQHLSTVKEDVKIVKRTIANVLKSYPMARVELSDAEIKLDSIEKALKSPSILLNQLETWFPYHDLPKICKKLELPITSKVFWIKHKELEMGKPHIPQNLDGDLSTNSSPDSDKEKEKEDEIKETSDVLHQLPRGIPFLTRLSDECCELYTKFWDDFIKGNDVNLSTVQKTFELETDIPAEIEIIERYVKKDLNETSKAALFHWRDFREYKNCVKAMKISNTAFGVHIDNDDELKNSIAAFESLVEGAGSLTLFESHKALITVEKASKVLRGEAITVLKRFGRSQDVIDFLKEIVDEDPRNLIDAVEEFSENYVKESTVSGLIDVKRFLDPFIEKDSSLRENPQSFFLAFYEKLKSFEKLDEKIHDCMNYIHGLRSLYQNLANRSERTREIIKNILEHGSFLFILKNHRCSLTVKCKYNESKSKYSKARLVDLRSRALLLMNTARKDNTPEEFGDRQKLLKGFVTYIDLGLEIADVCTSLHVAGHIHYIKFKKSLKKESLNECSLKLKSDLESWYEEIKQSREEYYFLNFLNGGQIQSLYEYLQGHDENELTVDENEVTDHENELTVDKKELIVDTFLKFIHPQARVEGIQNHYKGLKSDTSNKSVLMNMGKTLDQAFKNAIHTPKYVVSVTEYVQNRKVLIALLEEEKNESVVKTVLGLYQISSRMPEAHQVLFCQQETTWDEVELLLQRCLGAPKVQQGDSLFCLANTEMLSNEIQFQLVNSIQKLPNDRPFCLALVFRGPRHHAFLHEFLDFVTCVQPMADDLLQTYLHQNSRIFTITSQIPGLGKTEYVKRYAHENRKKSTTFHVSGPIRKQTLVERLSKLNVKTGSVLHIDVGNTPDTKELDIFLFELLVLKYVSAYSASVFLTTDTVCIEIANTMNNTLPNSLPIVTSFKRIHLDWKGFDTLHISCELCSPVQVVCHYLNKLENGTLDKRDLLFKGTKKLDPLPPEKCRELLQSNVRFNNNEISYTLINNFVQVLADQLKKMSCSGYFRKSRLSLMLGSRKNVSVKTDLVKAMVELSLEFTDRSIKTSKEFQAAASKGICPTVSFVDRIEGMIRWKDSNHLVLLFHSQDIQTLTALYRDISKVPPHIKFLFESQMKKDLPNFDHMSQEDLQNILVRVARSNQQCMPKEELNKMAEYYALTPDNLLKMVLIMLRIRAHIPVILMGETGCGKTSLIQYLSKICDVDFNIVSIHAGLEEGDIIHRVEDVNEKAFKLIETNRQVWLFLDEINTNDQMWLLSDIVCHHSLLGKKLAPNLVLMAACNPYRLRSKAAIHTAGLKRKAKVDQLSRLVYRVHPLPETMIDYVWDFSSLSKSEEELYIKQMVCGKLKFMEKNEKLLVSALLESQEFIRKVEESSYHVSLRDVRRCRDLSLWFKQILIQKKEGKDTNNIDPDIADEMEIRAIVLALAHCYHSRLTDSKTRENYREALCPSFKKHFTQEFKEADIKKIIREEQKDILDRMELPPGTAKNSALQENVFVILVCILTRIPVFVVGKPGCSKSLSMQVIKETLKGRGSKNEFFQSLPQLYCVSFQGSESSTSDGIVKVFKTAQNYQNSNSQNAVQTVVILDEIGLAEVSRFNPLKVLHSLMEPTDKPYPDVAFVGISNWALDASKMNRAIYLSRPEMDWEELSYTGQAISDSLIESSKTKLPDDWNLQKELDGIAKGYIEFVSNQSLENFYGLRDYYSLVKYFAGEVIKLPYDEVNQAMKGQIILKGISINFGGQPAEMVLVSECFKTNVEVLRDLRGCQKFTVLDLIKENLEDRSARHLMLITTGDSALGILEKQLRELKRDYLTIFGSKFEEDLTDDYSYRILSRIILCMEQGLVLILKDLETLYGSLYDMLNQNYQIIRKKKNCRIALGPYSNPICHVHDNFRCVVLVEESELNNSDPPFFSRFEKQHLQYFEVMDDENKKVMSSLEQWIISITSVPEKHFSPEDIFPIYSKDMIPSLVLHVSSDVQSYSPKRTTKFEACKFSLLEVMKPEAVIRLGISEYGKTCKEEEIKNLQETYFKLPIHNGLAHFLKSEIREDEKGDGKMIIIFTNSNIHIDLKRMVQDLKCQIEKLGAFRAEKQLIVQLEHFWQDPKKKVLFLQCKADTDAEHVLLAKSMIEKSHSEYHQKNPLTLKHVCIIVHLDRHAEKAKTLPQINFLVKWKLALLDSLEEPPTTLPDFMKMDLVAAVQKKRPLDNYIKENLSAAFTCIRYGTNGRDVKGISDIVYKIQSNPDFLLYLDTAVMKTVQTDEESLHWHRYASCDVKALYIASTFINVLERHIVSAIYKALAMLIYELEKHSLLDSFFVQDSSQRSRQQMWQELCNDKKMFQVDKIPLPKGPECYTISTPVLKLHMPFSRLFFERMEEERESFCEFLRINCTKYDIEEIEKLDNKILQTWQNLHSQDLSLKFEEAKHLEYENWQLDYVHDFSNLVVAKHFPNNIDDTKINIMQWLFTRKSDIVNDSLVDVSIMVHTAYWTNPELIMNQFILIEICRELVDMSDILPTEFTPYEAKQWKRMNFDEAQSNEREYFEGRGRHENPTTVLQGKYNFTDLESTFPSEPVSVDDINKEKDIASHGQPDNPNEVSSSESDLVVIVCKRMLQSIAMFRSETDLKLWNNEVQNILSIAGRVSSECSVLYGLRFCSDLTSLILVPYNMGRLWLVRFGDLLLKKKNVLDSEFCAVVGEMLNSFIGTPIKTEYQQKLLSQFVIRNLQSAEDSADIMDWLLQMIERNQVPDPQLSYLKKPLHYALHLEMDESEDKSKNIFCQIIEKDSLPIREENKFLDRLNTCIKNLFKNSQDVFPLATLLLDIFEQDIFGSFLVQFKDINVEHLKKAERIICKEEFSLIQLLAIAYYRKCLKIMAVTLQNDDTDLSENILKTLDAYLINHRRDIKPEKKMSLQLFFLKVLKAGCGFNTMQKKCKTLTDKFVFLSTVLKRELVTDSADTLPLPIHNTELYKAALKALDDGKHKFRDFVNEAIIDENKMLLLHSVCIQKFYLKRSVIEVTDNTRNMANDIRQLCQESEMDEYNKKCINCYLGSEFAIPKLNLHVGSNEPTIQVALLISELSSLALSKRANSNFFVKCIIHPQELSETLVPGIEDRHVRHEFTPIPVMQQVLIGRCSNHHRFAVSKCDGVQHDCSLCSSPVLEKDMLQVKEYIVLNPITKELIKGRNLTTVSQSVLQIIIYCLFAGSIALEHSNQDDIERVLHIVKEETHDIGEYLFSKIESNIRVLEAMIGFKQTELDYFLSNLFHTAQDLIWKDCPSFMNISERNDWERKFTDVVSTLVQERFTVLCIAKKQVMSMCSLDRKDIEYQIQEIDEVGWCPCLFRLTREPSLANLSLEMYEKNKAGSFRFLALVLRSLPQLEVIQHIRPLISWHKACVMYASYKKRKEDFEKPKYSVSMFIHEENDEKRQKDLNQKFESCKTAWEALKKKEGLIKDLHKMESIHIGSPLESCIIMNKDSPMYKLLEILVSMQNTFLDETLALSVSDDLPALNFLCKNSKNSSCACFPCIPLADVRKGNIITFEWSDNELKFSQCNLQYGQGQDIAYDLQTIEMELANSLLLGKSYILLEKSFPRIIFRDELYKTYIRMIQELKRNIPQEKLPVNIEKELRDKKNQDPEWIADLLTHLGVIISLLRRTHVKPETPLVKVIDDWDHVLAHSFSNKLLQSLNNKPSLCHIVELNELLEELNADGIIGDLDNKYCVPLEDSLKNTMDCFHSITLTEVVLKAEKRFVHKCLHDNEVGPMASMLSYMIDEYFWPAGSLENRCLVIDGQQQEYPLKDLFPENILVQHVCAHIQFLTQKIKDLKAKEQSSSTARTLNKTELRKNQKKKFNLKT